MVLYCYENNLKERNGGSRNKGSVHMVLNSYNGYAQCQQLSIRLFVFSYS